MENLERIKALVKSLPKSDISYAETFIEKRDFLALRDLVISAIFRIRKSLSTDNPKQEYLDANLSDLNQLRAEVDIYLSYLGETIEEGDYGDLSDSYVEEY